MKGKNVTFEEVIAKADELMDLLPEYQGNDYAWLAEHMIYEIVSRMCGSRYEGIGILTEALFRWRCDRYYGKENENNEECNCDNYTKEKEQNKKDNDKGGKGKNNNGGGNGKYGIGIN